MGDMEVLVAISVRNCYGSATLNYIKCLEPQWQMFCIVLNVNA
jgi:hypothetical protein